MCIAPSSKCQKQELERDMKWELKCTPKDEKDREKTKWKSSHTHRRESEAFKRSTSPDAKSASLSNVPMLKRCARVFLLHIVCYAMQRHGLRHCRIIINAYHKIMGNIFINVEICCRLNEKPPWAAHTSSHKHYVIMMFFMRRRTERAPIFYRPVSYTIRCLLSLFIA